MPQSNLCGPKRSNPAAQQQDFLFILDLLTYKIYRDLFPDVTQDKLRVLFGDDVKILDEFYQIMPDIPLEITSNEQTPSTPLVHSPETQIRQDAGADHVAGNDAVDLDERWTIA